MTPPAGLISSHDYSSAPPGLLPHLGSLSPPSFLWPLSGLCQLIQRRRSCAPLLTRSSLPPLTAGTRLIPLPWTADAANQRAAVTAAMMAAFSAVAARPSLLPGTLCTQLGSPSGRSCDSAGCPPRSRGRLPSTPSLHRLSLLPAPQARVLDERPVGAAIPWAAHHGREDGCPPLRGSTVSLSYPPSMHATQTNIQSAPHRCERSTAVTRTTSIYTFSLPCHCLRHQSTLSLSRQLFMHATRTDVLSTLRIGWRTTTVARTAAISAVAPPFLSLAHPAGTRLGRTSSRSCVDAGCLPQSRGRLPSAPSLHNPSLLPAPQGRA